MEEFDLPRELVAEINAAAVACARRARRRVDRAHARPAAVRRRLDRPDDQADRHQHEGRRPGLPRHDVRRDGRRRTTRRWRRSSKRASISCCPKRSSTRSTSRRACSRSRNTSTRRGRRVPVMVSGTFDKGGATFVSGQSIEAFWNAVVALPAAHGRHELRPRPRRRCGRTSRRCRSVAHGADSVAIPTPACPTKWASSTSAPSRWPPWSASSPSSGWVNILGGCCGTTPEHIAAIARRVAKLKPHKPHERRRTGLRLSGTQPLDAAARQQLPHDRRADQRHRLARSSPSSSRTRSTKKPSKSPASRSTAAPTSSTSTWTRPCSTAKR